MRGRRAQLSKIPHTRVKRSKNQGFVMKILTPMLTRSKRRRHGFLTAKNDHINKNIVGTKKILKKRKRRRATRKLSH